MPSFFIRSILFCLLIVGASSCNRVENAVDDLKEGAQNELKEQTQNVIDEVFPPFDADQADTDNNKERFKDFIKIDITSDIKNIYCFDDAVGIDADYMFSFKCDSGSSNKIIATHELSIDTLNSDNGFGIQHDFDWWDKDRIAELQKFSWTDGKQYHKYYWYDVENETAYFFDFDL